TTVLEVGTTLT
nr:immunoglobulin heavy chain junction region [Mus musculus]